MMRSTYSFYKEFMMSTTVPEDATTTTPAVEETATEEVSGGPGVYRVVQSQKTKLVGSGIEWLGDFSPTVDVVRDVMHPENATVTRMSTSTNPHASIRRGSGLEFLSARGQWHTRSRSARFTRNHNFPFDEAVERAHAVMSGLVAASHLDEGQAEVQTTITHEIIAALPIINARPSYGRFFLSVIKTRRGYKVVNYGRQMLSKSGEWHRLGSSARFIRNHYFSYDEAVERAIAALPTLTTGMYTQDGFRSMNAADFLLWAAEVDARAEDRRAAYYGDDYEDDDDTDAEDDEGYEDADA
jgi:hypothetical protein